MDKNTILDYATNSPENTNRNVLGSMLDQFTKGGGSGNSFLIVNETFVVDPDNPEVIDAVLDASYNDILNADYAILKYEDSDDTVFNINYLTLSYITHDPNEETPYIVCFNSNTYGANNATDMLRTLK